MATISYTEILFGIVCFFFLYHWAKNRNSPFINWPLFGMLPGFLWNLSQLHDHVSKVLIQSRGTFEFNGPWFSNLDFLFTSDPINTNHILSKSFLTYQRGPEFGTIFEPLFGDGIFVADSDSWKFQRKMTHSFLKDANFQLFLEKTIQEKVVKSLIPVLDHLCIQKMEVNMEDVFRRLGFDISCLLFLGCDPKCLSMGFPEVPYERAFEDVELALLHRNFVPGKYWKLLKWLQIGPEKKLTAALKIFDDFVLQNISSKRENYQKNEPEATEFDFLTAYLMEEEAITKEGNNIGADILAKSNNKFLRDVATNLVIAGRDTTSAALSWFFWILATHQTIETKILEEISEIGSEQSHILGAEDVNKLIYLHAALCETLRLYPSVPFNHKCAMQPDTLPSGHRVKENTMVFVSVFAMGRTEQIWGEDWSEFKPERWISKDGRIVHVPSYKFTAFGAGPRSCLGKDMSFVQMKIVAAAMILRYQVRVVENHLVLPTKSIGLRMKHGLQVRLNKKKN